MGELIEAVHEPVIEGAVQRRDVAFAAEQHRPQLVGLLLRLAYAPRQRVELFLHLPRLRATEAGLEELIGALDGIEYEPGQGLAPAQEAVEGFARRAGDTRRPEQDRAGEPSAAVH
mgnify:CR=1 FL=1